jgi:hypothetical protein
VGGKRGTATVSLAELCHRILPAASLPPEDKIVFDGAMLELIKRVRPSALVKRANYRRDEVVGRDVVEAAGGDVILVDLVPGQTLRQLCSGYRAPKTAGCQRLSFSATSRAAWRAPHSLSGESDS